MKVGGQCFCSKEMQVYELHEVFSKSLYYRLFPPQESLFARRPPRPGPQIRHIKPPKDPTAKCVFLMLFPWIWSVLVRRRILCVCEYLHRLHFLCPVNFPLERTTSLPVPPSIKIEIICYAQGTGLDGHCSYVLRQVEEQSLLKNLLRRTLPFLSLLPRCLLVFEKKKCTSMNFCGSPPRWLLNSNHPCLLFKGLFVIAAAQPRR